MKTLLYTKKNLFFLFLLFQFFLINSSWSQPLSLSYEKKLDEIDGIYSINAIIHNNSGFALYSGDEKSNIKEYVKLRNNNIVIWKTEVNHSPNYISPRGFYENETAFYYTGEDHSYARMNKTTGVIEVEQSYLSPNTNEEGNTITETHNGNFIFGGGGYDFNNNSYYAFVTVVNQLGDHLITKKSNESGGLWGHRINQIEKTTDNGYILAGSINETIYCAGGELANKSLWLCKLDNNLNVLWSKKYGNGNGTILNATYIGDSPSAIITADNEIIILGATGCTDGSGGGPNNTGDGKWLMKLNSSGDIIDLKFIDTALPDYIKEYTGLDHSCDGNIVLSGMEGGLAGAFYFIDKYDLNLNYIETIFTALTQENIRFVNILSGEDNSYMLHGEKYYYDQNGDYQTFNFIAKTTQDQCASCSMTPDFGDLGDCDDFEGYITGNISPQANPRFTLFDAQSGQATIVNNAPQNNSKSLKFVNGSDIDYNVANSPNGRIISTPTRLEWRNYFPSGKTGSWGLETNNENYAIHIEYSNGLASVLSQNTLIGTFPYDQNKWFKTSIIFSPVKQTIELWSAGNLIHTLPNFVSNQITDLNFFATNGSSSNEFYIDDILYYEVKQNGCVQNNIFEPVCVSAVEYSNANFAQCDAYTVNEWTNGPCCSLISVASNATHTKCGLNNGSITAIPTGGSNHSYEWSNGATTQTISNLAPGNYTVTVTAQDGCSQSSTSIVNSSTAISLTISSLNESCNNCNNGSATAIVTGGSGYTFQWSNGATTQTISNLAPGNYSVTVTSNIGCISTNVITITEFGCPTISIPVTSTDPLCYGDCNGAAIVSPSGGTAPYTYLWSNGSTTNSTNGLCAGQHFVTILDANGCANTASFNLDSYDKLLNTIVQTISQTENYLTANVTGGKLPYTYSWNTGGISDTINILANGSYKVTVTDANGCQTSNALLSSKKDLAEVSVKIYPNPANEILTINSDYPIISASLFDINGKMLLVRKNEYTLNLREFKTGMYVIKIQTSRGISIHKLTIVK